MSALVGSLCSQFFTCLPAPVVMSALFKHAGQRCCDFPLRCAAAEAFSGVRAGVAPWLSYQFVILLARGHLWEALGAQRNP